MVLTLWANSYKGEGDHLMGFKTTLAKWLYKSAIQIDRQLTFMDLSSSGYGGQSSFGNLSAEGYEACSTVYRCINI